MPQKILQGVAATSLCAIPVCVCGGGESVLGEPPHGWMGCLLLCCSFMLPSRGASPSYCLLIGPIPSTTHCSQWFLILWVSTLGLCVYIGWLFGHKTIDAQMSLGWYTSVTPIMHWCQDTTPWVTGCVGVSMETIDIKDCTRVLWGLHLCGIGCKGFAYDRHISVTKHQFWCSIGTVCN